MKRKIITLTIIDNKIIYYDITKNEMYESLKNVENNRNVYIFAGMFFIYFFKYFWNYNPLGKFLYSIPNCIPKFLIIFIAIILSYIEFINENKHIQKNIGRKISIENYEKFFQSCEIYAKKHITNICCWGFAFLIYALPTLLGKNMSLWSAILCIFSIKMLINSIVSLNFFKREKIYEEIKNGKINI